MNTVVARPGAGGAEPVKVNWDEERRVAGAADTPDAVRLIHLDRGYVVRLRGAAGTRVRAITGTVSIVEQCSDRNAILVQGRTHTLISRGMALVLAHGASCIVLETPGGVMTPAQVELAYVDVSRAGVLLFKRSRRARLTTWLRALRAWWRRRLRKRREAAADACASQVAEPHAPEGVRDRLLGAHLDPF